MLICFTLGKLPIEHTRHKLVYFDIALFGKIMDPFLTIYSKDYLKKIVQRPEPNGRFPEYKDPIGEAFKNYLQLSSVESPSDPPIENVDKYLEKHSEKYPRHAKMYFQTPVNNAVIKKDFIYNGRSEYQVDFCDLEKDEEYKEEQRKRNMYRLPNDWDVPLTTQKYSYRNPLVINSRALEREKQTRLPNNLDPSDHIRAILKVTTGKTEYSGVIGDLGESIINEQLHGEIVLS